MGSIRSSALPRGFVRVEESLEDAVRRELHVVRLALRGDVARDLLGLEHKGLGAFWATWERRCLCCCPI
jgi:hypothetical protein